MNPIQAMFDELSRQMRNERSNTQMTLGGLIEKLESLPSNIELDSICNPHSYRGYYSDIAFQIKPGKIRISDALSIARSCMGKTMTGYKGGDYMMGDSTPVWAANYGCCGEKLMGISDDGELITKPDQE